MEKKPSYLCCEHEVNALILSIRSPLEQSLAYLKQVLQQTANKLVIELHGQLEELANAANQYDILMSHLIIFYSFINKIKCDNPFFDGIVLFPQILGQNTSLDTIKFERVFLEKSIICSTQNAIILNEIDQKDADFCNEFLRTTVSTQYDIIKNQSPCSYPNLAINSKQRVALGGTFDHLHVGHKLLLSSALLLSTGSEQVVCGLAGQGLLAKKKNVELLQSFAYRKQAIIDFSQLFATNKQSFNIFELIEPMGPLKDQEFDALVISHETFNSSQQINAFRVSGGLKPIDLFIVDVIGPEKAGKDFNSKASSTDVRNYLLDKNQLSCEQFNELRQNWMSIFETMLKKQVENNNIQKQQQIQQLLDCWLDKLKALYSQPWRYYHTLHHVYSLLQSTKKSKTSNPREIDIAVWFHDAIYNPLKSDNEKRSEELFLEFSAELKAIDNQEQFQTQAIALFIRATGSHTERDEYFMNNQSLREDLDIFLDNDLSILGSIPEVYDAYSEAVRLEYSHIEEEQFKVARSYILKKFLDDHDTLFRSPQLKIAYQEQARTNISREIMRLSEKSIQ